MSQLRYHDVDAGKNTYYEQCFNEVCELIPDEEMKDILSQYEIEFDCGFLGFLEVYKPLSLLIPKECVVIDFGCYCAPQSYYFRNHKLYIGVDVCQLKRFNPDNCVHYFESIQDFIKEHTEELKNQYGELGVCAICSYVPDSEAVELVRKTFSNVFCYYPGR